ncbi:MAG: C25 family cysteine peptidase [candidate division WOR-3 bacterium]
MLRNVIIICVITSTVFGFKLILPVEELKYQIENIQGFQRINLENGASFGTPGAPEIPAFVYNISLPSNQRIKSVRVIDEEWSQILGEFYIYPVQAPAIIGETLEFTEPDSAIYNSPLFYPQNIVTSFHSGNLRGYRIGQILITPFRYNPLLKRLELLNKLCLEIETEYEQGGIRPLRQTGFSKTIFEKILFALFENKNSDIIHIPDFYIEENLEDLAPSDLPSLLGPPVDLVIITTQSLVSAYEHFAYYKKLLGFNTAIKTMEWIKQSYSGIDDAEKVRNFIKDAVEKWGVSVVILGNDVPDVPTRWVWVEYVMNQYSAHFTTDLYYSDLDRNWNADGDERFGEVTDSIDFYPDVLVGRIPAHSADEVMDYLEKIFSYIFEIRNPPNSLDPYYKKALFVTSMFFSQDDSYYIARNRLSPKLPVYFRKDYLNEESTQNVFNGIKDGYNLITWLAHGDVNVLRVRTSPREYITNFDFDSLHNNIYPFLVVVSCYTGPFQEDCLGEHWVMNPHGGGIGYMGPTSSSAAYTHLDYIDSFFPVLFSHPISLSLALAKIPWIPNSQYDNWHRVFQYSLNLIGDPTIKLWSNVPHKIDSVIASKDTLHVGNDTISLRIFPAIDNFLVVLFKENETFIKDSGFVGTSITPIRIKSTGWLKYTVISDGFIPYIDSIFIRPDIPYPVYHHLRMVDTLGNGNGIANPDETIELYINLVNNSQQIADSVFLRVNTQDSFISTIIDTARYPAIPPEEFKENLTPLILDISPATPDGYSPTLYMEIHCGSELIYDTCQFFVESPVLKLFTQRFTTNGSVYKIVPFVENSGHWIAESVYVIISSLSDTVTVLDSIAQFDDVRPNEIVSANDTLKVLKVYPGNVSYKFALYIKNLKVQEKKVTLGSPSRIDSLWSYGTQNSIILNWTMVMNSKGYRIYRSTAPNNNFEFIKNPLLPAAYFEDLNVEKNRDYYYYIVAVDSSMNEGIPSDTIMARVNPSVAPGWPRTVFGYLFSSPNFGDLDPSYPGLEIVVCSRNGDVHIWHNDGTPVNSDIYGRIFTCGAEIWSSPAVGDVDDNGTLEVCFGIRRGWDNFYVLTKCDTGWIPMPGWPRTLGGGVLGSPVLADIDGDEDLEIFVISENGKLFAFHHNGEGLYSPDGLLKNLYGWHGGSPAIGDINNDGNLEIIACGGSNSDSLFAWDRYGNYLAPFPIPVARKMSYSPVLGNVSGDADLEICFYTDSTNMINLVDALGHILWQRSIPALGDVEAYPAIANITGNERPEIIVGSNKGFMFLSALDSLGNIIPGFPTTDGYEFKLPIVSDVDGDNLMDIICGAGDWNLYAFNNNGSLVRGFPIHFGIRIEQSPAVYDIDGDCKLELMVGADDFKFWVFELNSQFFEWPKFRYDPYNSGWYRSHYWAGVKDGISKKNKGEFYFGISPNPSRNGLNIRYTIPDAGYKLKIYDISGRVVKQFDHLTFQPFNQVVWDGFDDLGRKVSAGVYFVQLETPYLKEVKKAVLLK